MFEALISVISLPLKLLTMGILSVFARLFHEDERLKVSLVATRIVTSTFILWVVFVGAEDIFGLSENLSLVIAGISSFAYREVLDFWLGIAKNPLQLTRLRDMIKKKDGQK